MHSLMNKPELAIRVLIATSLLILLMGCGSSPKNQPSAGLSPTQVTANPSPTPEAFDVAGLRIDPASPACARDALNFGFARSNLVLAKDPQSYDAGQIQQITGYVSALVNHLDQPLPPLPDGLLRLQGSLPHPSILCVMELRITNIGAKAVQLLTISAQLTAAPQPNTASYRLIDTCSLVSPSEKEDCRPSGGWEPGLSYRFALRNAPKDTIFTGTADVDGIALSTPPILDPGQPASVTLFFESTGSPDNFIYTVRPELTIQSIEGGTRKLDLQQLTSQLYFADQKQFSCYSLQGSAFVLVSDSTTKWCL